MTHYLRLFLVVVLVAGCRSTKPQHKNALQFIPENYVLYQKLNADLNYDGILDCILIIKNTNPEYIVVNSFDKTVDRNRRGIIILFKNKKGYQLIDKNINCFYSENEEGYGYYAPQLTLEVDKGDIIFNFEHGKYGYWNYRFRLSDTQYKLIKYYRKSTFGPKTISEITINFLSKEKLVIKNVNQDDEGNSDVFKETTSSITLEQLIELSHIKDFEELQLTILKL